MKETKDLKKRRRAKEKDKPKDGLCCPDCGHYWYEKHGQVRDHQNWLVWRDNHLARHCSKRGEAFQEHHMEPESTITTGNEVYVEDRDEYSLVQTEGFEVSPEDFKACANSKGYFELGGRNSRSFGHNILSTKFFYPSR